MTVFRRILRGMSSGFKWVSNTQLNVTVLKVIEMHYSVFWRFTAPKSSSWMGFPPQQKLSGLDEGGDNARDVNWEYTRLPTARFLSWL